MLETRAQERHESELVEYEAKLLAREEKARQTGRKPRGRAPQPPVPRPRAKDQYNFTDPESRIMKNSTDSGFNQHYNVQVAVEQSSFLIVSNTPDSSGFCGFAFSAVLWAEITLVEPEF